MTKGEKKLLSILVALIFASAFLVTLLDALSPPQSQQVEASALPPGIIAPVLATFTYQNGSNCSGEPVQIQLESTLCLEDPPGHITYMTCSSEYFVYANCSGTCRSNPLGLCPGMLYIFHPLGVLRNCSSETSIEQQTSRRLRFALVAMDLIRSVWLRSLITPRR